MRRIDKDTKTNTKSSDFNKADAFLNLIMVDKNGNEHKLRKGVPLDASIHLERSIINLVKAYAEKGEVFTFNLTGTVHINATDDEQQIDIAFE